MGKTSLAVVVVSVLACGSETERAAQFAEELEIDMTVMTESPSGLAFQDLVLGDGEEAIAGQDRGSALYRLAHGWIDVRE